MEDMNAGPGSAGPGAAEPATGPVSGTPSSSGSARPLLPRIRRDAVITFVNETLDAVEQLADKLADMVGMRGKSGLPMAPPPPPAPPSAPPPPPPGI